MALNEKHKLFVVNYIATNFNAIEAYELTYPKSTRATARTNAYKLLKNEEIKAAIQEAVSDALAARWITADRVLMEISEVAFAQKGDEIYNTQSKLKALEMLQKQMGLLEKKVEVKQETTIEVGFADED